MVYWSYHKIKEREEHGDDFLSAGEKLNFDKEFWIGVGGGGGFLEFERRIATERGRT